MSDQPMATPEVSHSPEQPIDMDRQFDFDGGLFTLIFSDAPEGFDIVTDKSHVLRPENDTQPLFSKKNPTPWEPMREDLRKSVSGQMDFAGGNRAKNALDAYRAIEPTEEDKKTIAEFNELLKNSKWEDDTKTKRIPLSGKEISENKGKAFAILKGKIAETNSPKLKALLEYQDEQSRYELRSNAMYVIENIRIKRGVEKDTLTVDTRPTTYPVYDMQITENSATAGTVITKDNKIPVQIRHVGNDYGDILGAGGGAGGNARKKSLYKPDKDVRQYDQGRRSMPELTGEVAQASNLKEMHEEIGFAKEDLIDQKLTAIGIAHEKASPGQKKHKEILYLGRTELTSTQVQQKAKTASDNVRLDPNEFMEKFVFIDATSDALKTLLVKTKTILPPTHNALYTAVGHKLAREEEAAGKKPQGYAKQWLNEVSNGLKAKNEYVNQVITEFYKKNPEMKNQPPLEKARKILAEVEDYAKQNPQLQPTDIDAYRKKKLDTLSIFKRNPIGYVANFGGQEQGLMDPHAALEEYKDELGLIKAA